MYLDLDSTLLGPSGSILRGADGRFTTAGIRALELLDAAGLPFVLVSGRSDTSYKQRVELDAR